MHCELFKIYCAPPNLDITWTWICRLNFAQRPIFSGLRYFNLRLGTPSLKVPPGGLMLRIFTSWKNPSTSAGFEPANLGSRGEQGPNILAQNDATSSNTQYQNGFKRNESQYLELDWVQDCEYGNESLGSISHGVSSEGREHGLVQNDETHVTLKANGKGI